MYVTATTSLLIGCLLAIAMSPVAAAEGPEEETPTDDALSCVYVNPNTLPPVEIYNCSALEVMRT